MQLYTKEDLILVGVLALELHLVWLFSINFTVVGWTDYTNVENDVRSSLLVEFFGLVFGYEVVWDVLSCNYTWFLLAIVGLKELGNNFSGMNMNVWASKKHFFWIFEAIDRIAGVWN